MTDLERVKGTKPFSIALSIVTRPNSVRLDIQMLPIDARGPPSYAATSNQRRFSLPGLQQLPLQFALLANAMHGIWRDARQASRDENLGRLAAEIDRRATEAGEDVSRAARCRVAALTQRNRSLPSEFRRAISFPASRPVCAARRSNASARASRRRRI